MRFLLSLAYVPPSLPDPPPALASCHHPRPRARVPDRESLVRSSRVAGAPVLPPSRDRASRGNAGRPGVLGDGWAGRSSEDGSRVLTARAWVSFRYHEEAKATPNVRTRR